MKNVLLLAVALIVFISCGRQITALPQTTQAGTNTFGAKINGSLWGPAKFGVVQTAPILAARFAADNSVVITARNFSSSPTETEMEICLKNIQKTGMIYLNQSTAVSPNETASYGYFVRRKIRPVEEWITNNQLGGWVNVTRYDPESRVIAGTFEFQAANILGGSAPITVTEGRFDVTIQ